MFKFQDLSVYNKSVEISVALSKEAYDFPYQYSRLRDQLIGAVISIALNIAEGSGRYNSKEKIQFYRIAQSSAFELIAIMDIADGLGLLPKSEWCGKIEEISKMISGLIKSKQLPNN